MNAPLRVGLVGLGVIAPYYIAAFDEVDGVELTALCDLRAERLTRFRDTHRCYTDHRVMLAEAELDAVIINVPNDVHAALCADAIAAGLAVCVEKPLATDLGDAQALRAAARAAGVTLFTAFHRRYNDNIRAVLAAGREHGAVRSVVAHYDELIEDHVGEDEWYLDAQRCGGGCVADNGPNAFDTVRMFLPGIELVRSSVTRDADGVDRTAEVVFATADGAEARVLLDWSYPHGERKDIRVTYADGTELYADALTGHDEFKGSLWHEYVGILRDFARAVRTGGEFGDDGVRALELVTEVYAREAAEQRA